MHLAGIEPATSRLSTACYFQLSYRCKLGCKDSNLDRWLQRPPSCLLDDIPTKSKIRASDGIRTRILLGHSQALHQLSYTRQNGEGDPSKDPIQ